MKAFVSLSSVATLKDRVLMSPSKIGPQWRETRPDSVHLGPLLHPGGKGPCICSLSAATQAGFVRAAVCQAVVILSSSVYGKQTQP